MATEKDEARRKSQLEIVQKHVNQLAEHFPNVQIFVNTLEDGADGTFSIHRGAGNYFARLGQVIEWVTRKKGYEFRMGQKDADDDLQE